MLLEPNHLEQCLSDWVTSWRTVVIVRRTGHAAKNRRSLREISSDGQAGKNHCASERSRSKNNTEPNPFEHTTMRFDNYRNLVNANPLNKGSKPPTLASE